MFKSTIFSLILSLGLMSTARAESEIEQIGDVAAFAVDAAKKSSNSTVAKIGETTHELASSATFGTLAALSLLATGIAKSGHFPVIAGTGSVLTLSALTAFLSYMALSKLDDALLDGKTKKFVVNGARKAFKKIKESSRGKSNRNIAKANAQ